MPWWAVGWVEHCERAGGVWECRLGAHVVSVASRVADAEDGDLLAGEVEAGEVAIDELVPRGARALRVGAGVPRGRADDQAFAREGSDASGRSEQRDVRRARRTEQSASNPRV